MDIGRSAAVRSPLDFGPARILCIRGVESARMCVKETCGADDLDECRSLCEDTATVLEALVEMLERPYETYRAVSLRRMIEAGLATVVECGAECAEHADDVVSCAACATDCAGAADALRQLLRELADDDADERSSAT
ncbi:MAG: hypothetical protein HZB15_08890 [Actinobacteria bacterium]|nr:hypothetical protein [Actinomycetota bacterium]